MEPTCQQRHGQAGDNYVYGVKTRFPQEVNGKSNPRKGDPGIALVKLIGAVSHSSQYLPFTRLGVGIQPNSRRAIYQLNLQRKKFGQRYKIVPYLAITSEGAGQNGIE